MADDLVAIGFEAEPGLKRIEVAVQRVPQRHGDTDRFVNKYFRP